MRAQLRNGESTRRFLIVKIAVIVLALGAALFFAFRGSPDESQPDDPASAVPYICLNCKHVSQVTPADYQRLGNDGGIQAPRDPEGGGMVMLRCSACGQLRAVRAEMCPKDGTSFPRRLADGQPGQCPRCGYRFYAR